MHNFYFFNTIVILRGKILKKEKSNAERFINAYNKIDYAIRTQNNFKRSMGFSDMIRRAVSLNNLVRKYEDDLVTFGRLRNAIIHGNNEDQVIAEPHDSIVLKIEAIAKVITTPPKALDVLEEKQVFTFTHDVKIVDVIKQMSRTNFSNIPVYKDNKLVGVANGQKILDALGGKLLAGENIEEFLNNCTIEEVVTTPSMYKYYDVIDCKATVDTVLNMFFTNRKLVAIIVTKTGSTDELPLGIITSGDYMQLNTILDNY